MFHFLQSLRDLLLRWASSQVGNAALASVPRNPTLASYIRNVSEAGSRITGEPVNTDALAGALTSLLK